MNEIDGHHTNRIELQDLWSRAKKILTQESRSGCADRTVFGGLEKFISNWHASLSSPAVPSSVANEADLVASMLEGYRQLPTKDRAAVVAAALQVVENALRDATEAAAPPLPAGAREGRRSRGVPQHPGHGDEGLPPAGGTKAGPAEGPTASRLGVRGPRRATPNPTSVLTPTLSPWERESSTLTPVLSRGDAGKAGARTPPSILERGAPALRLDAPVTSLRGVGKLRAAQLARLGITSVRDLLLHFPRDYRDFRNIKRIVDLMYGETASVLGVVEDVQVIPGPHRRFRTTVKLRDESGRVTATWFRYGYGGPRVAPNSWIALAGSVSGFGGQLSFDSPDWEPADARPLHTRRLVPVYPLTEGLSDYWLRELMAGLVPAAAPLLEDPLPAWILQRHDLMGLPEAVAKIHSPRDLEEADRARRRLAFDELFLVQMAALKSRVEWQAGASASSLHLSDDQVDRFLRSQPFELTAAQRRVIEDIRRDLRSTRPMTRLLQGEVGSGKTIVAAVALLSAVASGCQGALMAPTEILAEQHGRTLRSAFANAEAFLAGLLGRPLRLEVLTSASKRSDRDRIYRGTVEGEVDVLVGTQALIQEGLGFRRLGLAVVDEQHRFGVVQRTALRQKGGTPHLLVMTATPIPRTLALTLYGDLDLSIIDELPPGRQRVESYLLGPAERPHAYEHIRREVARGRQAFIICPLVEDSPNLEARAATAEYERLRQGELSGLRLALLHGKMRPAEKDEIMRRFRDGEYDVLVSTSVVEVGIDVPNATVMLVDGAERFGLAQLHQFRGRVGRGQHPSSCILLTDSVDESVLARLNTVVSVSDGFRLADEDLKLRGPGEYFGVKQSGFPDFRMADLRDVRLVEIARDAASELLARDPTLAAPEHAALAARLEEFRRIGSS